MPPKKKTATKSRNNPKAAKPPVGRAYKPTKVPTTFKSNASANTNDPSRVVLYKMNRTRRPYDYLLGAISAAQSPNPMGFTSDGAPMSWHQQQYQNAMNEMYGAQMGFPGYNDEPMRPPPPTLDERLERVRDRRRAREETDRLNNMAPPDIPLDQTLDEVVASNPVAAQPNSPLQEPLQEPSLNEILEQSGEQNESFEDARLSFLEEQFMANNQRQLDMQNKFDDFMRQQHQRQQQVMDMLGRQNGDEATRPTVSETPVRTPRAPTLAPVREFQAVASEATRLSRAGRRPARVQANAPPQAVSGANYAPPNRATWSEMWWQGDPNVAAAALAQPEASTSRMAEGAKARKTGNFTRLGDTLPGSYFDMQYAQRDRKRGSNFLSD